MREVLRDRDWDERDLLRQVSIVARRKRDERGSVARSKWHLFAELSALETALRR